jgi:hypothetical protein
MSGVLRNLPSRDYSGQPLHPEATQSSPSWNCGKQRAGESNLPNVKKYQSTESLVRRGAYQAKLQDSEDLYGIPH